MPAAAIVTVDDGAAAALAEGGRSLLAVGVSGVVGNFEAGQAIDIATVSGTVFAKGLARLGAAELQLAQGSGNDLSSPVQRAVVVHVDDMVMIPG